MRTRRNAYRSAPAASAVAVILLAVMILATTGLPAPATAALDDRDRKEYELAFRAIDHNRWKAALRHARRAGEPLPLKAVMWLCHQSTQCPSSFDEITGFVRANPTWPRLERLEKRAEQAIGADTPDAAIIRWFEERAPKTGAGAMHYLRALERTGDAQRLKAAARQVWRDTVFGYRDERDFRRRYRKLITTQDELDRLETLIWDGDMQSATRQARRVPRGYRDLAEARIHLRQLRGGVDGAIARVPDSLKDHPGLVYERLRWRRIKERNDDALELLKYPDMQIVRPDLWWRERAILARRAFNDGQISRAYELASDHRTTEGADFALAEWFSGWIALRYLRDPEMAFPHFRRMYDNVGYPVSLSRAAYWAGRAAEAGGRPDVADTWYREAAQHATSFYGQMAAMKLPAGERPAIPLEPAVDAAAAQAFEAGDLPRLVRMLAAAGADDSTRVFIDHMAETYSDPANLALLGQLARDIDRPELAVLVSREAIKNRVVLSSTGYPVRPLSESRIEDANLVLGLIRQESAFDADAMSHAGARGLMQLMPATARLVSKMERVRYRRERLTEDPPFNVHLGTAYLKSLLEDFDGYLPMALAAYNAGPYRVKRWVRTYGDPRSMPLEEQIDWMESIPYRETRDYVQRVLENITVYRQRAAGRHVALSLTADAR